mgnify:CR=1 FL=1
MKVKNAAWLWSVIITAAAFLCIGIYLEELGTIATEHFVVHGYWYKVAGTLISDIMFPLLLLYFLRDEERESGKNAVIAMALISISQFIIIVFVLLNEFNFGVLFMKIILNMFYFSSVFWAVCVLGIFLNYKFNQNKIE